LFEGGTTKAGENSSLIPEGIKKAGAREVPGETVTPDSGTVMSPLVENSKLLSSTPKRSRHPAAPNPR
jgi:hypothetical protein